MLQYILIAIILFYYHVNVLLILAGLLKSKTLMKPPSSWPLVTTLIAARNEEKVIEKTLKKLANSYPNLEIIVIDDASTDNTGKIAKNYAKVITNKHSLGKPISLNKALQKASAEFIYILDADSLVTKNTISKLVATLQDKTTKPTLQSSVNTLAAVHGPHYIHKKKTLSEKAGALEYYLFSILKSGIHPNLTNIYSGKNFLVRSDVAKKLKFKKVLTEDINFSARFLANGYKAKFVSDALVTEQAPSNMPDFFKQQQRWFKGALDECIRILKTGTLYNKSITMPHSIIGAFFIHLTALFILVLAFPLPLPLLLTLLSGIILGILTISIGLLKQADRKDFYYLAPVLFFLLIFMTGMLLNAIYLKLTNKNLKWFRTPRN